MSTPSNTPAAETLKRDARTLASDAMQAAKNHIVQPTVDAVHRAGDYAREAAGRATDYAREAASRAGEYARETFRDSRKKVGQQLAAAERYASQGYDRTTTWISANPLAAVGVALVAGLLLSTLFRGSRR